MKEKGFTLIELLAVIVILAIIALISTPIIIGVINKARKGTFEDSAYGILDAGRLYVINKIADDNNFTGTSFDFSGDIDNLKISGDKPAGGKLILDSNGKQGLAVWDKDKKWCAYKDYAEEKITIKDYIEEECKIIAKWNAVQYITKKNIVENTEGLLTEDKGNIRYAGNNTVVKNYIRYNNEEWRIIGIFDGMVKIVRNNNIGKKNWNSNTTSNNWATSALQTYLNVDYYNSLTDEAKNMIEETKYYLGGHTTTSVKKGAMYDYERGNAVYSDNPTEWTGKIALMYPSDYGYAAISECVHNLSGYINEPCKSNTWISIHPINREWLLTPSIEESTYAFSLTTISNVEKSGVTGPYLVRPTLHLKSSISITSGDGTQENPYLLVQ